MKTLENLCWNSDMNHEREETMEYKLESQCLGDFEVLMHICKAHPTEGAVGNC